MRQIASEQKVDPLMRIQEEIKEVVRREQEYHRQLTTNSGTSDVADDVYAAHDVNGNNNDSAYNSTNNNNNENDNDSLSLSPIPPPSLPSRMLSHAPVAITLSLDENASNTPSLASSVNSKESLDEQHSDDSGISASSSPINNGSAIADGNRDNDALKAPGGKDQRYIGPNCYTLTPEPPQQKLMTRTVSTPHLAVSKPRQFNFNPAQKKGVMQRFFASRGKFQLNGNNGNNNKIYLNGQTAAALFGGPTAGATIDSGVGPNTPMNTPIAPSIGDFGVRHDPSAFTLPPLASAEIERDAEGRPVRPGYVPVELKIQRELKDLKSRETELKKIRKIRESTSDLLASIDNENSETDDEDDEDSEVEHCYGPGKLRNAKSISDMCDTTQSNGSLSPRATPSPDFVHKMHQNRGGGMRPAMSLAQLCDLDPEEAPSSHRLIAQWESLIQQKAVNA